MAANFFTTPGFLATAKGLGNISATYFGHKVEKYETQRQNYESERQFWVRKSDLESKNYREYEYQQRSWLRDSQYTAKRRQYEQLQKKEQAKYKSETALAAEINLERQLNDIDAQFYEENARETIAFEQEKMNRDAISAKKSGLAAGKVGRSVNAVRGQYDQILLASLNNKNITKKWRIADKLGAANAAAIEATNATKDIQDYIPNPVADPIKPLAPLPVKAIPPAKKAGPSSLAMVTKLTGNVIDAIDNYKSMQPPKAGEDTEKK